MDVLEAELGVSTEGHHFHLPAEDAERRQREDPEAILTGLGLGPGQTFVDVGCGGGYYTIPAARIVGPDGRVYAIDVNQESLDELKEAAERAGLSNITRVVGRGEDTVVCQRCADFVFYAAVLHDFDDPAAVLRNAAKVLKPGGRLVDLDWKKEETPFGPPHWKRFSVEKATKLIKAAGLSVTSTQDIGYSYVLLALAKK